MTGSTRFISGGHVFCEDDHGRPYIGSEAGRLFIEPGTKVHAYPIDGLIGGVPLPGQWVLPVTHESGSRLQTCIADAERIELARRGWIDPCVAPAEPPKNDKRAEIQRSIANAIREGMPRAGEVIEAIARGDALRDPYTMRAYAAAAKCDIIADALAQVRQVVLLERDESPARHREPHATVIAWIAGGCSDAEVMDESPGHSAAEIRSIRATVRATLDYAKLAGMDGVPALVPDPAGVVNGIAMITGEAIADVMDRISADEPIEWAQELEIIAAAIRKGAVENV